MATYTPNIGLHQWVPEDDFLRTDFNTDFQKIDTAIGQKASVSSVSSLQSQLSSLTTTVNGKVSTSTLNSSISNLQSQINSLDSGKSELIAGSYIGDGADSRDIYLGFRPTAIWICVGATVTLVSEGTIFKYLKLTSTGFNVTYANGAISGTNNSGTQYAYIILR